MGFPQLTLLPVGTYVGSVRLRLRELLDERNVTPYALAKANKGLDPSVLYRILRKDGRVRYFEGELLEKLVRAFDLPDTAELFEVEGPRAKPKRRRKRQA
jgi:hypothetical protein